MKQAIKFSCVVEGGPDLAPRLEAIAAKLDGVGEYSIEDSEKVIAAFETIACACNPAKPKRGSKACLFPGT